MTQGDAVAIHPLLILVHLKKKKSACHVCELIGVISSLLLLILCFFFLTPRCILLPDTGDSSTVSPRKKKKKIGSLAHCHSQ